MIFRAAEAQKAIWAARDEFTKAVWAANKGYLITGCQFCFSPIVRYHEEIPYIGDERIITFNADNKSVYEPVYKFAKEAIAWAYDGLLVRQKLYELYEKEYNEIYGECGYSYNIYAPTVTLELSTFIINNNEEIAKYKPSMILELDELEKNGYDKNICYNVQLRCAKQDGTKHTPAGGRCFYYEDEI